MTDPIKIPLLNQKTDIAGNPVPVTHADLPPAAGIANTMTVHEHVRIVQFMSDKYHALLKTHQELIAKHEALKTTHEEDVKPMPHEEVKEEIKKDPIPQAELEAKLDAWKQASAKASDQEQAASTVAAKAPTNTEDTDANEATPASKPVVFTPKVPSPPASTPAT